MRDDQGWGDGPPDGVAAVGPLAAHAAFPDLSSAAAGVLRQLCRELGFRLWALTRVSGTTYTVLTTGGGGFPAAPGGAFRWVDTLCHRVIDEGAPESSRTSSPSPPCATPRWSNAGGSPPI